MMCSAIDESQVMMTFEDWLCCVTERMSQTMHYQFDGSFASLTVYQLFNSCLYTQSIQKCQNNLHLVTSRVGCFCKSCIHIVQKITSYVLASCPQYLTSVHEL